MKKPLISPVVGLLGTLLTIQGASAADIFFVTDFEDVAGWSTNIDPNTGITYGPSYDDDFGPAITATRNNPDFNGVTETIFASANTRYENGGLVTNRNWDIHDGTDNPIDGDYPNSRMSGNMLGHEDQDYDEREVSYYQLDGIDLTSAQSAELVFDFDSWISSQDLEGFAVAVSDGSQWNMLNPSQVLNNYSEMQYDEDFADWNSEKVIANYTGQDPDEAIRRFNGSGYTIPSGATNPYGDGMNRYSGTAIFDLALVGQNVVSLRFVFASDGDSSVAKGINIDNILVHGQDDPAPPSSVTEPLSLGLAMAGVAVAGTRRRRLRSRQAA